MFVEIFRGEPEKTPPTPGSPVLAGVLLGILVVAVLGFFLVRLGEWIPSLLFGSAVVLFFVGGLAAGLWSIEGLAVMMAVILATGVAFLMEAKSDNEFELLNAKKDAIPVKIVRGGDVHKVGLEDVVVGDLVQLEMGDEIPADGRLVNANEMLVDQSLMTGESLPVRKSVQPPDSADDGPDKPGCLYRGTQIIDGAGRMVVCEVGDATALGQIARKLSDEGDEEDEDETADTESKRVKRKLTISKQLTPLQHKLTDLAELISKGGYIAAAAIFLALLIMRGLLGYGVEGGRGQLMFAPDKGLADNLVKAGGALLNYFVYMVIIIVVAVPEGLPMSVTVSLALAMRKMTRANSLVRQMVAVETIGSATVICSDKTGTLTQNKMQVVRLNADGATGDRGSVGWKLPDKDRSWPRDGSPLDWLALNAAVNATANLESKEGKMVPVGNSTEGALLLWLEEAGVSYKKLRDQFALLYQLHFNSERKRMTTVIRYGDRLVVLVKGASEVLLANTTHYQTADGRTAPWTAEAKRAAEAWVQESAGQAMRTLGFGYAVLPPDTPADEEGLAACREQLERDLVLVGFVAIRDPLRPEVKAAVDECRRAGIEVKMITGDNVETARAIARDLAVIDRGDAPIDTDDAVVLTHPKFDERYDQWLELRHKEGRTAEEEARLSQVEEQLAGLRVLARARPLDKLKMVELLQSRQQVVAMTGDGTNDAPALKRADVGLAMGIAGTEVAKEASKIVLLDDSFATIVNAVHWGRSLYENIQRFVQFQLTINVSALLIAFLGPFFGVEPPFTVLQLLWINVIMDTFASIALCSEPPRPGVMDQKPKRRDESIITPDMLKTILATAGFYVVVMLGLLLAMEHGGLFALASEKEKYVDKGLVSPTQAGVFFAVYVFFQVFNLINSRALSPKESGWSNLLVNKAFLGIVGAIAVVQILIAEVKPLADIFHVGTLGPLEWLYVFLITPTVLLFAEAWRQIRLAGMKKTV
jgi:Ca2+-transporting ATPase